MSLEIRDFRDDDYEVLVDITNRLYPDYPETVDEWRYQDEHRDPKLQWQRFTALQRSEIVGHCTYSNRAHAFHPQKFWIHVSVELERQGRGIGTALYEHLSTALEPLEPVKLWSDAREDMTASIRFLEKRGFVEEMREWESRLDVASFDFAPFEWYERRAAETGIRITTLAELRDEPEHLSKLYDLVEAVGRDVPQTDPHTPQSFEHFVDRVKTNPNLIPDGYFVALDGSRYIGLSNLWRSQAKPDELYVGLTGTRREYRRRGIAMALKLRTIAYAKAHGIRELMTWNASTNEAMLAINVRLGFVRKPAWIEYGKEVVGEL